MQHLQDASHIIGGIIILSEVLEVAEFHACIFTIWICHTISSRPYRNTVDGGFKEGTVHQPQQTLTEVFSGWK